MDEPMSEEVTVFFRRDVPEKARRTQGIGDKFAGFLGA